MELNYIILGIIGPWQIALIILALLLLFGGKKIPELMKGLGKGMSEFKKATSDLEELDKLKHLNKRIT
jgi:sec-independent protein translocase protein TatA